MKTQDNGNQTAKGQDATFLRGADAVAKMLGVHERTVSRWVRSHILPVTKIGRTLLFRVSDLEEVLARFTIPSVTTRKTRRVRVRTGMSRTAGTGENGGAE